MTGPFGKPPPSKPLSDLLAGLGQPQPNEQSSLADLLASLGSAPAPTTTPPLDIAGLIALAGQAQNQPTKGIGSLFSDPTENELLRAARTVFDDPPAPPAQDIFGLASLGMDDNALLRAAGFQPQQHTTLFSTPASQLPSLGGLLSNALLGVTKPADKNDSVLLRVMEQYRRRNEWNDRFEHWKRPASDSEEETILRARDNVRSALSDNQWLVAQGILIGPQGSYFNNTNVRREADIDLRLVHPMAQIEYGPGVVRDVARATLNYTSSGVTFGDVHREMRRQIVTDLSRHFGTASVDASGSKAIHVKGVTGSRAVADVVPCFTLHYVEWDGQRGQYRVTEGVALLANGGWIYNFPDQHHQNGKAKHRRTQRRFKKVVRIFKSLRGDMEARGIGRVRVPSFLIECLVYAVEDAHFLVDGDDLYGRVRRVALRMQELLTDPSAARSMREINGVKTLFFAAQAWTYDQAKGFVDDVVAHLGDA